MLVICEECGKNYRIDPEKITGNKAAFKCSACGHLIVVRKPLQNAVKKKHKSPSPRIDSDDTKSQSAGREPLITASKKNFKEVYPANWKIIRFGLTAKLFTMMIFISMIPLVMFSTVALKQTKNLIRYEAFRHTNEAYIRIAQHIDAWFKEKEHGFKILAATSPLSSMDNEKIESLFITIAELHPDLKTLFVLDTTGAFVAGTRRPPASNTLEQSYFKEILDGKIFSWQTSFVPTDKKPLLTLSAPVKQNDNIIGVLVGTFSMDMIVQRLLPSVTGNSNVAFLIRNQGRIRSFSLSNNYPSKKIFDWQPIIDKYRQGIRGLLSTKELTADDKIRVVLGDTAFGWGLAMQAEVKETLFLDQLMSFAYLLFAITAIFVIVIAWFSGKAISRPIIRLTDAAERISVGELDMNIQTSRKDEIGELAEAIARLQDSIRLSIIRLRRRR